MRSRKGYEKLKNERDDNLESLERELIETVVNDNYFVTKLRENGKKAREREEVYVEEKSREILANLFLNVEGLSKLRLDTNYIISEIERNSFNRRDIIVNLMDSSLLIGRYLSTIKTQVEEEATKSKYPELWKIRWRTYIVAIFNEVASTLSRKTGIRISSDRSTEEGIYLCGERLMIWW